MKLFLMILALVSLTLPALADTAPVTYDCAFTTECSTAEGACTDTPISFALVVEGESARYEGDTYSEPMAVHRTDDGVLVAYDRAQSTLTTIGTDGTAVHSSNLILVGHVNRAAQWSGTCTAR